MPDGSVVVGPGIGDGCSGCGEKARPPFVVRPPVSGPSNAMLISGADSVTWPQIGVDDRLVDDTPTRPAQPEPHRGPFEPDPDFEYWQPRLARPTVDRHDDLFVYVAMPCGGEEWIDREVADAIVRWGKAREGA